MKKEFILIVLAGLFLVPVFAQHPLQDKNWEVIFQDSCNTFNTGRWYKHYGVHGAGNGAHEVTSFSTSENVYPDNGKLVIQTQKKISPPCVPSNGNPCYYGGRHSYTSGGFTSCTTYHYGYYEIYAKLPGSDGYWPSFWLWNSSPAGQTSNRWYNEIDICEVLGSKRNVAPSAIHWDFDWPNSEADNIPRNHLGSESPCNYSSGYHWYGIEWTRNKIIFYIDRKVVWSVANNMGGKGIQNPMYIIINVWLYPYKPYQITSSTIFPNYMYIDQINGYCLKCDKDRVINEIANFNTFYYAVKKSITLSGATTIPPNSKISLKATNFIELKNGFEVPIGAELTLAVTSCEYKLSTGTPNDPNTPYKEGL